MKKILLLLLLIQSGAMAISSEQLGQIQANLELRLKPLFHTFDPNGFVFVKMRTERKQYQSTVLPFLFESMPPREGVLSLNRIEVVLMTEKEDVPPSIQTLVKEMAQGSGVGITVTVRPLPAVLAKITPPPLPPETTYRTIVRLLSHRATVPLSLFSTGFLFLCFLGWMFKSLAKKSDAIHFGIEQVAEAIEGSTKGIEMGPGLRVHIHRSGPRISTYSLENITALFCDCYWGQFDAYAAFLWGKLSQEKRSALLDSTPFMREYILWLSDTVGTDLGVQDEKSYLNPLPISHLDNETLTRLVRETPALLYKLPSLRRSALKLKVEEKVSLTRLAFTQTEVLLPELKEIPASSTRVLSKRALISLRNTEEEKEVLKLTEASLDLIESLPTLGWWYRIPDKYLQDTLKEYTAKELASAWIGPNELLNKLQKALPIQKYFRVQSYLHRTVPSRDSVTYRLLYQSAVAKLRGEGHQGIRVDSPKSGGSSQNEDLDKKAA